MRRDSPDLVEVLASAPLPASAHDVVAALTPMITPERMARIERVLQGRTRRLVVVLDQTTDPHNAAAVLRSADAFGVQEVHVIEGEQPFTVPSRIARGTVHWLDIVRHPDARTCAASLHARGYRLVVASMEGTTTPRTLRDLEPVAVVFGNEHHGVSTQMREYADGTYAIPMTGFVESLNVSVAAALTMFAATDGRAGDLSPTDAQALRARFMLCSVVRAEEIVRESLARGLRVD